ncbi:PLASMODESMATA CALLOSE-BINDING PROTEIN 4-like [Senna tora]|uniref:PLASMODESMATA CALLOSE-BINDING PROTEIN 4-like n=1 Tax=Senna tora TaxID=362788 RepID=A0A834W593_9FABA|nr:PLASMODESMATA CALLOSE-BINDING PROTEIN 4-like [Senna tora]
MGVHLLVYFVLLLALTGHSSGLYCVCKDGVGDQALQKALDYACGAGADCTPILQNGACFQPNTVKDHCSYAVNSYFQKKGQAQGSCDFAGAATTSQTAPSEYYYYYYIMFFLRSEITFTFYSYKSLSLSLFHP